MGVWCSATPVGMGEERDLVGVVRRVNRSWLLAAVLALLAVPLQFSTPILTSASAAAPTGSIAGFVTGPDGPMAGVIVTADSYYLTYAIATTDATGHYTISGLAPGTFHVQFTPPVGSDILTEWFRNTHADPQAAPVVVVGGSTTAGVNASLERAGHITGVVTGPNGTYPNYTTVCFEPTVNPNPYYYGNANCVKANAGGRYTSPPLAPGSYTVRFEPYDQITPRLGYQYYDGIQSGGGPVTPTPVIVGYGATVAGVNAKLRTGTGNCTTFGPDCTTVRNASGCINITQIGQNKARLEFTCAAQSVHWKSNNKPTGHDVVGNPVELQFADIAQQWAVSAEATASSTTATDSAVFKFSATGIAAPGTTQGVVATAGVEQAQISWIPPLSGGATSYVVTATPGGATCAWTAGPRSCSIKNLAPGTAYTFKVVAANATGPGLPSAASAPVTPTARRFSDVTTTHPFYGDIEWLAGSKVTTGYADGTYKGSLGVQRQAMAAFLYRIAGSPNGLAPTCAAAPFTDVPVGAPFCGEISWLKGTGITTGFPNGAFAPGNLVTREAMAAFLHRLSNLA